MSNKQANAVDLAAGERVLSVGDAVETRRSIKHFDPAHVMTDTEVNWLMERAILSPTAFNIQHWRFVRVTDSKIRAAIREAAWNQAQVTDASLLLVVCMDLCAWDKQPERYWRNAPEKISRAMISNMRGCYAGNEQAQWDEAMRSASMVSMAIMLLAREMGYDSCPMDGFDFDKVAEFINLPADHGICMMIAIGKPLIQPYPRAGQLDLEDVLFTDTFE